MNILELLPGELAAVPRFPGLADKIPKGSAQDLYLAVDKTCNDLGRAVQLCQHRQLIESLDSQLGHDTLVAMTAIIVNDHEICSALGVNLTTLEQAYHWPRESDVITPRSLHDHKLVVQMLRHPELRQALQASLPETAFQSPFNADKVAHTALNIARQMIKEARVTEVLPLPKQDRLNLLYRTCRDDWFEQGSYDDDYSHREFGRLHETTRTNGTQRRCQEIFEEAGGLRWLQRLPKLLDGLPASSVVVCDGLRDLQVAVALVRDELFNMAIDETIWGRTFARWSKAVGANTISAGGADCPLFRMLDALVGREDAKGQAALLDELDFRSRHFPPHMRDLIHDLARSPSIRAHANSNNTSVDYGLTQAFKGLQQTLYGLYEMHRKKAMRITLALRAGQMSTSSGIEKASSPEVHIAHAMRAAMQVRFGNDVKALMIDAYAWSSPLLLGTDGKVEVARTCIVFSTPLAVMPGDNVSVTIPLREKFDAAVKMHTRTYSVTHTNAQWCKPSDGPCQAASSVEVCIRNRGEVSSFLCSERSGIPVQVSINAAPHFRIQSNSSSEDETVFLAQGGAAAVFITWLAGQSELTGRYRLVIGVRRPAMLPYATCLQHLTRKFAKSLVVVACISTPCSKEVSDLPPEFELTRGRVTEYLNCYRPTKDSTVWYICGSSEFGMDIVNTINKGQCHHASAGQPNASPPRSTSRPQSITTSSLPKVRLHVAPGSNGLSGKESKISNGSEAEECTRVISRSELALHNSPNDMWIAMNGRVYDISNVRSFHPGGEKVLLYRAGREAGVMFDTVHGGSFEVESLLSQMIIGQLAQPQQESEAQAWEGLIDRLVEIQNDLTNQSRFEQIPTGCSKQLSRAPPVETISTALARFVAALSSLLAEAAPRSCALGCADMHSLTSTMNKALKAAQKRIDVTLERVYSEAFGDVQRCADTLRGIFASHNAAIATIHDTVDRAKWSLFQQLSTGSMPVLSIWDDICGEIVAAIEGMEVDVRSQ